MSRKYHAAGFHFKPRGQQGIAPHAPTATNVTMPTMPLTPERCAALAGELEALQAEIASAAEAIRALGDAGGEGGAPMRLRSQAHTSVLSMAEALQRAPALMQRALSAGG